MKSYKITRVTPEEYQTMLMLKVDMCSICCFGREDDEGYISCTRTKFELGMCRVGPLECYSYE